MIARTERLHAVQCWPAADKHEAVGAAVDSPEQMHRDVRAERAADNHHSLQTKMFDQSHQMLDDTILGCALFVVTLPSHAIAEQVGRNCLATISAQSF